MRIGIIGSGLIGGTLTRRLRQLGHEVTVANSRGPQTLSELTQETGAVAGTVQDATRDAELVVVAIPLLAVPELPADVLHDKVVVDTGNYYPQRDGTIAAIEQGQSSARWDASHWSGARVVKAFNNITSQHLLTLGKDAGGLDRIALPVAGDDAQAKATVLALVEDLGFDAVDAGTLDDSWRQEPGSPAYGTDLDADGLRAALTSAQRTGG